MTPKRLWGTLWALALGIVLSAGIVGAQGSIPVPPAFNAGGGGGNGGGGVNSVGCGTGMTCGGSPTAPVVNLSIPCTVSNGCTGLASPTAHGVMVGEGSSSLNAITCANNLFLSGVTGADPACRALTLSDLPTPANQSANTVYSGPLSGSATTPGFRSLSAIDVPGFTITLPNDATTGTTLHSLAKLNGTSTSTLVTTSTTDLTGILGLSIFNGSTTGNGVVQETGLSSVASGGGCSFDGPTTVNDFFQNSTTIAGDCHDTGVGGNTYPTTTGTVLGRVLSTNAAAGVYSVNLASPDTIPPVVNGGPLTVAIVGSPTVGPATLVTAFGATPAGGVAPYTYSWNFGDTFTSTAQNPSHSYTSSGTYTATLTVTDSASPAHTASQVKTVLVTGTAYYVSKAGSDSNNGLTPGASFLTLTKCQTAMRSGNKVCIINDSGTYTLGANLTFTSSDNGELWVAGFGFTPIIDGASAFGVFATGITTTFAMDGFSFNHQLAATSNCTVFTGTGITLRWDTWSSLCSGFAISSTYAGNGLVSSLIDSDTINSQTGAGFAALGMGQSNNTTVSHMFVNGSQAMGIFASSAVALNNMVYDRNIVTGACSATTDCGSLYIDDLGGTATGIQITNNIVKNGNLTAVNADKGIYLDSNVGSAAGGTSNATVSGNIVQAGGTWDLFLHCGNHNTITNNIFDVSSISSNAISAMAGYQDQAGCLGGTQNNNAFNHNIIYNSGAWTNMQAGLWWLSGQTGGDTNPTVTTNTYYSPTGNAPNPSGGVTDAAPLNNNPGFTNPAAFNYTMSNPPTGWTTLATNQGPVNSPFVAAGSTF